MVGASVRMSQGPEEQCVPSQQAASTLFTIGLIQFVLFRDNEIHIDASAAGCHRRG